MICNTLFALLVVAASSVNALVLPKSGTKAASAAIYRRNQYNPRAIKAKRTFDWGFEWGYGHDNTQPDPNPPTMSATVCTEADKIECHLKGAECVSGVCKCPDGQAFNHLHKCVVRDACPSWLEWKVCVAQLATCTADGCVCDENNYLNQLLNKCEPEPECDEFSIIDKINGGCTNEDVKCNGLFSKLDKYNFFCDTTQGLCDPIDEILGRCEGEAQECSYLRQKLGRC